LQDAVGSGKPLPNFGEFAKQKKEKVAAVKQDLVTDLF
jgi:hypothetical protein